MTSNIKEVTDVLCFVKLILRKIITIVATRCRILNLKLKCTKLISELIVLPHADLLSALFYENALIDDENAFE